MFRAALILITGFFLGGCGAAAPKLTVTDVRTDVVEPTGRLIYIEIDAQNRSDDALPLKDATYTLKLDGQQVFSGQRSPECTLRVFGQQKITLPVAVPSDKVPASGTVRYEVSGSMVYLPPGRFNEILYEYHLLRPTTSFSRSGQIALDGSTPPPPTPAPAPAPASAP
ncbi:MAG: hypothetical protein U0573_04140 [Phycisphaerales bacterium]|nr:LEA type 2 family protein [Planctomycetota bacterium]